MCPPIFSIELAFSQKQKLINAYFVLNKSMTENCTTALCLMQQSCSKVKFKISYIVKLYWYFKRWTLQGFFQVVVFDASGLVLSEFLKPYKFVDWNEGLSSTLSDWTRMFWGVASEWLGQTYCYAFISLIISLLYFYDFIPCVWIIHGEDIYH